MNRYLAILGTFALLVAVAVAQENPPAPKKKAVAEQDAPKNDVKKVNDKDVKEPDAKNGGIGFVHSLISLLIRSDEI